MNNLITYHYIYVCVSITYVYPDSKISNTKMKCIRPIKLGEWLPCRREKGLRIGRHTREVQVLATQVESPNRYFFLQPSGCWPSLTWQRGTSFPSDRPTRQKRDAVGRAERPRASCILVFGASIHPHQGAIAVQPGGALWLAHGLQRVELGLKEAGSTQNLLCACFWWEG